MNYIDLLNHFWKINREFSFTPNEKSVYFSLLFKWNDLHRKNPFNFSNDHLTGCAGMSVNAMKKAREVLKSNGLIDFNSGDGRKINTVYAINDTVKGVTYGHLLSTLKVSPNDSQTEEKVSLKVSVNDTLNEIKVSRGDDYISNDIEESMLNVKNGEEGGEKEESRPQKTPVPLGNSSVYSSMDDVEFICLNQSTIWQEHMTRKLSLKNLEEAKSWVTEFFDEQRAAGQDKRDLNDARSHCYSWIKKQTRKETGEEKPKGKAEAVLDLHSASTEYWEQQKQAHINNQNQNP